MNIFKENTLFAGFDNFSELQDYIDRMSAGNERALANIVMMMTYNTCARISNTSNPLEKELDKGVTA